MFEYVRRLERGVAGTHIFLDLENGKFAAWIYKRRYLSAVNFVGIDIIVVQFFYQECCLLGCGAVWTLCEPTLRRNVSSHKHGATSQKTVFFIVTAMKISNLT
jgi:hypothetical protein